MLNAGIPVAYDATNTGDEEKVDVDPAFELYTRNGQFTSSYQERLFRYFTRRN